MNFGALKNPIDPRDIKIAQVQTPVSFPKKHITDISFIPVFNQLNNGSCVGHAHATVHMYNEYKETGKLPNLSPRYIYALSKKIDGYTGEGTYPRTACSISKDKGCATENTLVNDSTLSHVDYIAVTETEAMTDEAYTYRIKGYVDAGTTLEDVQRAIYQNGVVAATISVGNTSNPIKKGSMGYHRVVLYGYNKDKIYFRNSWGDWGNDGNGYFRWKDQEVTDTMVLTDIPNEIKQKIKDMTITITRNKTNPKQTTGVLKVIKGGAIFTCNTLELPDLNNAPNISCIPAGTYTCKWTFSPKFMRYTYQVMDVKGRSGIRFHKGNYAFKSDGKPDIQGCILLGNGYADINRDTVADIINSTVTTKAFEGFMDKKSFILVIK